jgi:hypothetical protein
MTPENLVELHGFQVCRDGLPDRTGGEILHQSWCRYVRNRGMHAGMSLLKAVWLAVCVGDILPVL